MNSEEKKEINNDSSDEILTIPNILSFFRILHSKYFSNIIYKFVPHIQYPLSLNIFFCFFV